MKSSLAKILVGLVALSGMGCGDDDDGNGSCGDAAECGGDITGTWEITSSCLNSEASPMSDMGCEGITGKFKDIDASGTATFNADETYERQLTIAGSVEVSVPATCLKQGTITLTCAQLQQTLEATASDNGYESVACAGSSGCTCTMELEPQTTTSSGTYSTSGGKLTQVEDGGSEEESSFCVSGKTLTLSASDAQVSGNVVLTKQ